MIIVKNYRFDCNLRSDSLYRITCRDLPGFRLLEKSADPQDQFLAIDQALEVFLPLYKNAIAVNNA